MLNHLNDFSTFITESEKYHKETKKLYVTQSGIQNAGYGLFAKVDFEKGDKICNFTGKLLTDKESSKISDMGMPRSAYLIDLKGSFESTYDKKWKSKFTTLDVYNSTCMAKYANDAEGFKKIRGKSNNADIGIDENGQTFIYATKNIKAGDEVFVGYGEAYWDSFKSH